MPFDHPVPRPFTSDAVRMYAPTVSGLYGISNAREWIYIGIADDIQGALLAHLADRHAPVMEREPTGFVFEVCAGTLRPGRRDRLVLEYGPACNRSSPRPSSARRRSGRSQEL